METVKFSRKGQELIALYGQMAREGYERTDKRQVTNPFSLFGLQAYRKAMLGVFQAHAIQTVLDYGCGGSDWRLAGFDGSGASAVDYFKLKNAFRYEPARNLDERQRVDCVLSFDVLEHIFISDVPAVLREMFSLASRLLVLNVACYPAAAKLPNGENAHITVRQPTWWKGMIDGISVEYPAVSVLLICSTGWRKSRAYRVWKADTWQQSATFVVPR
jgi:hypothetical protein